MAIAILTPAAALAGAAAPTQWFRVLAELLLTDGFFACLVARGEARGESWAGRLQAAGWCREGCLPAAIAEISMAFISRWLHFLTAAEVLGPWRPIVRRAAVGAPSNSGRQRSAGAGCWAGAGASLHPTRLYHLLPECLPLKSPLPWPWPRLPSTCCSCSGGRTAVHRGTGHARRVDWRASRGLAGWRSPARRRGIPLLMALAHNQNLCCIALVCCMYCMSQPKETALSLCQAARA